MKEPQSNNGMWTIHAYLWVKQSEDKEISLILYAWAWAPYAVNAILNLDPDAIILDIGDIDEHGRLVSWMWNFQPTDIRNETRQTILRLISEQQLEVA